jgi:hypothetical protein
MKRPRSNFTRPKVAVGPIVDAPRRSALAVAAFVCLAAALTVRPLLGDMWTVQVSQLINPSPLWWNNSPAVMYISHLVAALGMALGGLWVVLERRTWRFTGLEVAAGLFVLAAMVSVPGASDKRLAINVVVGTILPIAAAAVLVQVLAGRPVWRRALLAVLLAAVVANCWRSTHQQVYEHEQTWQYYLENKADYWRKLGKSLDDPTIPIFEARIKAHQPLGYFYLSNVLASFMLLGIAGAGACLAGLNLPDRGRRRWRRDGDTGFPGAAPFEGHGLPGRGAAGVPAAGLPVSPGAGRRPADRTRPTSVARIIPWTIVTAVAFLLIIAWCLVVIYWVGSLGAKAGILGASLTGLIVWIFRRRPWLAGALCLAMLALLQISLVVLAARADTLAPSLAQRGGKARSFAFRLDYWHGALQLFAQHPLGGVGPGQFGTAYPSVKPARAAEEVAHPHNWLLSIAAEWGTLGLLATVAALVLPIWSLRRRGRPGARSDAPLSPGNCGYARKQLHIWDATVLWMGRCLPRPWAMSRPIAGESVLHGAVPGDRTVVVPEPRVLLLSWASVLFCWMILLPGGVPAGSAVLLYMIFPAFPFALVAAALASISPARGRAGQVILMAGLAGFFVHATVEMSGDVAAATWPFWACMAMVLGWSTDLSARVSHPLAGWRALRRPTCILSASSSLAVLALSVGPMRGIWDMNQAKSVLLSDQPFAAEGWLKAAAEADRLDPSPQEALSAFYLRVAKSGAPQPVSYLRRAVDAERVALDRDPGNYMLWHDLAWTTVELARETQDFSRALDAIEAMRRSVRLYPLSPRSHLKLATLLAGATEPPSYHAELLRESVAEYDTALKLNEQWPAEDPSKLDAEQVSNVRARQARVRQQLNSPPASRPQAPATLSNNTLQ